MNVRNIMRLSIVTRTPHYSGSRDLSGDSILYFVTSKVHVQLRVLPGTAEDIFLVNPRVVHVGPRPITPGTFGKAQSQHMRTS